MQATSVVLELKREMEMKGVPLTTGLLLACSSLAAPKMLKSAWIADSLVDNVPGIVSDSVNIYSCEGSEIICNDQKSGRHLVARHSRRVVHSNNH